MDKLIVDLEMADKAFIRKDDASTTIFEIIEIGAVLLDENNKQIAEYISYVKPEYCRLSKKITKITGITEDKLENAPKVTEALKGLTDIVRDVNNTTLYTWSDTDIITMKKEIFTKDIHNSDLDTLIKNFVDLQKEFDTTIGLNKQSNLEKALNLIGIDFEGTAHDALVDAKNTAKIYTSLLDDAKVQKIVETIKELFEEKPMTTTLGSRFDFSQFKLA
jgi:ERI1 exoribonuclease 2